MRFVLDCSVAIKWFVPEALSGVALALLQRLEAGELTLVAPDSIAAELGYALRKIALAGDLSPDRSQAIVQDFVDLPITTVPVRPLAPDAMRLTTTHMAGFYDAIYMALAMREDLKVLTADNRMAQAFARLNRTVSLASLA